MNWTLHLKGKLKEAKVMGKRKRGGGVKEEEVEIKQR
jgi:hypothetical protein